MKDLWRPISELEDKYSTDLLLCAPELVDLDCNEHGIGMGYWQDDHDVPVGPGGAIREKGADYGGFVACKWCMSCDEWHEVKISPTHFIVMKGP